MIKAAVSLALSLVSIAAFAQQDADVAKLVGLASGAGASSRISAQATCPGQPITVPASIKATLMVTTPCRSLLNDPENVYLLDVNSGERVTMDLFSKEFEVYLFVDGAPAAQRVSGLSSGTSRIRLQWTATSARTYRVEVMPLRSGEPKGGAYTLQVTKQVITGPALYLGETRFKIEATWKDFAGNTGIAAPVPLSSDTGYFWFFSPDNAELMIKVLDGRGVNGRFWVFYGALSNVEYTITITDLSTGQVKTYTNRLGEFGSVGDTNAF